MGRVEVGRAVIAARQQRRLSQEKLAAMAGVTRVTLSRVERGDESVQERTLDAVLRAAGLHDLISARPGADLSDEELMAELERRRPGLIRALVDGDPVPPMPHRTDIDVTRKGDTGGSASQPA